MDMAPENQAFSCYVASSLESSPGHDSVATITKTFGSQNNRSDCPTIPDSIQILPTRLVLIIKRGSERCQILVDITVQTVTRKAGDESC